MEGNYRKGPWLVGRMQWKLEMLGGIIQMWPGGARKGPWTAAWTMGGPVAASAVVGVVKTNKQSRRVVHEPRGQETTGVCTRVGGWWKTTS